MRIITWNIFSHNPRKRRAIEFALSQHPDVLLLQEVGAPILSYLQHIPGYTCTSVKVWDNARPHRRCYICILSGRKPGSVKIISYHNGESKSLLNRVMYRGVLRNREMHRALYVRLRLRSKTYHIVNAYLTSAAGTSHRLHLFSTMMEKLPKRISPIVAGDMNISDSRLFQLGTGWMRGFTRKDYRLNERTEFEKLFRKYRLVNIFRGTPTFVIKYPFLQFDHILVPDRYRVTKHAISRRTFGSDHKMLLADIEE